MTGGVDELDQDKSTPLLRLKYHNSISDAVWPIKAELRDEKMEKCVQDFQKYLYQQQVA